MLKVNSILVKYVMDACTTTEKYLFFILVIHADIRRSTKRKNQSANENNEKSNDTTEN